MAVTKEVVIAGVMPGGRELRGRSIDVVYPEQVRVRMQFLLSTWDLTTMIHRVTQLIVVGTRVHVLWPNQGSATRLNWLYPLTFGVTPVWNPL